jgi:hypothetical protein
METTETVSYETPGLLAPHLPIDTGAASAKPRKRKRAKKANRESLAEPDSGETGGDEDYRIEDQGRPPPLVPSDFVPDPGDRDFYSPSVTYLKPGSNLPVKKQAAKQSYRDRDRDNDASDGSSGSAYEGNKAQKKTGPTKAPKPKAQRGSGGAFPDISNEFPPTGGFSVFQIFEPGLILT